MAKVKRRRFGHSTISSKHQVTIPMAAIRDAGLRTGDRLAIRSTGPGRIEFERVEDPVGELAGVLTGRLDRKEIEGLRDEWD